MKQIREISEALAGTKDAALIARFLRGLLTPVELAEVASRWELVKRLERGHSQRQIAADLGLSLCKITRGARELKKKDSAFRAMLPALAVEKNGRKKRK
jgi:TrpR family transcriptional regulator, trp operon repressor